MSTPNATPNIVVISTHDTGRHFGCYGVETVHTPAIDRLANEGFQFTNYFAVCPVCSPSRGAAMTGRYPQSNALTGLLHSPWDYRLNRDEKHLARLLSDNGYYTAMIGIQHEDYDWGWMGFKEYVVEPRKTPVRTTAINVAKGAEQFFEDHANDTTPFYAQIGFFETHAPYKSITPDTEKGVTVPPYLENDEETREYFARIQGSVRLVNEAVECILNSIDKAGLADNTIVVFTVDHGMECTRSKWTLRDAGIEIPLLIRYPDGNVSGGKKCKALASNVDLTPTLLDLAGLPQPENLEGTSLCKAFKDPAVTDLHDSIFGHWQSSRYVRTATHKLTWNFEPLLHKQVVGKLAVPTRNRDWKVELYDLMSDPLETKNLADEPECASIRKELLTKLRNWMVEVDDELLKGPEVKPFYRDSMEMFTKQFG